MSKEINWEDRDYPALYNTADISSLKYQKIFIVLFASNLILLTLCAFMGYLNVWLPQDISTISIISIIFYVLVLLITLSIKLFNLEKTWYNGRAVAESVKSMTWKFMMRSEPYFDSVDKNPREIFLDDLENVLREIKDKNVLDISKYSTENQISDKMSLIRECILDERKFFYLDNRIREQQKWYVKKSKLNRNWSWGLNVTIFFLQIFAIVLSIIFLSKGINVNSSIFPSITAGLLAWMQMKKHDELSQSYAVATQDLGLAEGKLSTVIDDVGFSLFVSDTETAISREHTVWLARRDILDYRKLK